MGTGKTKKQKLSLSFSLSFSHQTTTPALANRSSVPIFEASAGTVLFLSIPSNALCSLR